MSYENIPERFHKWLSIRRGSEATQQVAMNSTANDFSTTTPINQSPPLGNEVRLVKGAYNKFNATIKKQKGGTHESYNNVKEVILDALIVPLEKGERELLHMMYFSIQIIIKMK